jgi:hypothetical protein
MSYLGTSVSSALNPNDRDGHLALRNLARERQDVQKRAQLESLSNLVLPDKVPPAPSNFNVQHSTTPARNTETTDEITSDNIPEADPAEKARVARAEAEKNQADNERAELLFSIALFSSK